MWQVSSEFGCGLAYIVNVAGDACRLLAMAAAALSVAVVVAEASISPALPNLSIFSRGLHALQGSQTWAEVFCCLSLVYPIACAYYGLYK